MTIQSIAPGHVPWNTMFNRHLVQYGRIKKLGKQLNLASEACMPTG
jgi:hypothetical protein